MKLAPIVVFAYNRPNHLKLTLEKLRYNKYADKSILHIFCDGIKVNSDIEKNRAIRSIINNSNGFQKKYLHFKEKNIGLANSIITGVSEVFDSNESAIILEDDLLTHPFFLSYMNHSLNHYKENKNIFLISGYNHPSKILKIPSNYSQDIYFSPRASSWGWATWSDRWKKIEWNTDTLLQKIEKYKYDINHAGEDLKITLKLQKMGVVDSWAVRFCTNIAIKNGLVVYPIRSLIENIGMDGSGRHSKKTSKYANNLTYELSNINFPKEVTINDEIIRNFLNIYKTPLKYKIFDLIKKVLNTSQ